jgi:hypothetical protein
MATTGVEQIAERASGLVNDRLKRLVRENRRQASVRGRLATVQGPNLVTLSRSER